MLLLQTHARRRKRLREFGPRGHLLLPNTRKLHAAGRLGVTHDSQLTRALSEHVGHLVRRADDYARHGRVQLVHELATPAARDRLPLLHQLKDTVDHQRHKLVDEL